MKKGSHYIIFSFITLVALLIRYEGRNIISDDMSSYLIPWFETIKNAGGFAALNQQVGDYGLLYQTIIALFSYVDIDPVYLYKLLSILFDILLAVSIAYFVNNNESKPIFRGNSFLLSYAYIVLLPTVVMNSAFWGQCDSIYTFFALWGVWWLYKEKYKKCFFMFGCALAFKLQTVLLFPLVIYYYFKKGNFSFLNSFITFGVFWLSGAVSYFYGRGFLDGIKIYSFQVGEYKSMWKNVPSFWALISDDYNKFFLFAIGLTLLILLAGLYLFVTGEKTMNSFEQVISVAAFIEWTCILFLPAMHERYTYVLDLLIIMMAFVNKKYMLYAFITSLTSCLTYNTYLFSGKEINIWLIVVYLLAYLNYSYALIHKAERT